MNVPSLAGAGAAVTVFCLAAMGVPAQSLTPSGGEPGQFTPLEIGAPAAALAPSVAPDTAGRKRSVALRGFTTLVRDHAMLWTSPIRSPRQAIEAALPFVAATAVALQFDQRLISGLPNSEDQIRYSKAVSEAGAYYSLGAAAGAFVAVGAIAGNGRALETGLLAAASVAHTESISQMLKYAGGRERPDFGDAVRGRFWRRQQSFPSGHAMATWAVATVISREYHDNPFIRYGIYALPVVISASRIGGQRHFLSDVVAGGALGHLIGGWMYDRHHNPALGGAPIRKLGVSITPDVSVNRRWSGFTVALKISR